MARKSRPTGPLGAPVFKERPKASVALDASLRDAQERFPSLFSDEGIDAAALEIGLELKQARIRSNLTQADLEARTGIKQGAISDIERGKGKDGPSYRTIRVLSDALGVSIALLPAEETAASAKSEQALRKIDVETSLVLKDVVEGSSVVLSALIRSMLTNDATIELAKRLRAVLDAPYRPDMGAQNSLGAFWQLAAHEKANLFLQEPTIVMVYNGSAQLTGDRITDQIVLASPERSVSVANTGSTTVSLVTVPLTSSLVLSAEAH